MDERETAIEFFRWCNEPLHRPMGCDLKMRSRVFSAYPDNNSFTIINEEGDSIIGRGIFLSIEQLYAYWIFVKDRVGEPMFWYNVQGHDFNGKGLDIKIMAFDDESALEIAKIVHFNFRFTKVQKMAKYRDLKTLF